MKSIILIVLTLLITSQIVVWIRESYDLGHIAKLLPFDRIHNWDPM